MKNIQLGERVGSGNNGGLSELEELKDSLLSQDLNGLGLSLALSSCSFANPIAWAKDCGCNASSPQRISGIKPERNNSIEPGPKYQKPDRKEIRIEIDSQQP